MDRSIFDFLRQVLLLEHPEGLAEAERAAREAFVVRFQQITGPVQAKGLEDTAFYRQFPLGSLNEVAADPTRLGYSARGLRTLSTLNDSPTGRAVSRRPAPTTPSEARTPAFGSTPSPSWPTNGPTTWRIGPKAMSERRSTFTVPSLPTLARNTCSIRRCSAPGPGPRATLPPVPAIRRDESRTTWSRLLARPS